MSEQYQYPKMDNEYVDSLHDLKYFVDISNDSIRLLDIQPHIEIYKSFLFSDYKVWLVSSGLNDVVQYRYFFEEVPKTIYRFKFRMDHNYVAKPRPMGLFERKLDAVTYIRQLLEYDENRYKSIAKTCYHKKNRIEMSKAIIRDNAQLII